MKAWFSRSPLPSEQHRNRRRYRALGQQLATVIVSFWILTTGLPVRSAGELTLPMAPGSVRLAVIGDSGTGESPQRQIGQRMAEFHDRFPFEFVLMLGDNLYGEESARDYQRKFIEPYRTLLDRRVEFYAALGNHDNPNQRFYERFNMEGRRYYSFADRTGRARFFALDSTYMTREQVAWLDAELRDSDEPWKICFLHHPLYSSGRRHGPDEDLRSLVEPLFIKHGVSAVFAGHDHFYERLKPQHGVAHFVAGGAARVRRGNIAPGKLTEKGFDRDLSFVLVEIAGDNLHFQAVSRAGDTVDSGVVPRRRTP